MNLTYRGDPALKALWIARAEGDPRLGAVRDPHADLSRIVAPERLILEVYGGCAALDAVESEIFQRLSEATCGDWTARWLAGVPVGVDPRLALDAWIESLLADPARGLAAAEATLIGPESAAARGMAALYRRRRAGDEPDRSEWLAARRAADALGSMTALASAIWAAGYYALERHLPEDDPAAAGDAAANARSAVTFAAGAILEAAKVEARGPAGLAGPAAWNWAWSKREAHALWLGETLLAALAERAPVTGSG